MEMNTDKVTLNGVKYVREDSVSSNKSVENTDGLKYVLIRSYAAGVHIGYLKSQEYTVSGKVVVLVKTRRIWSWAGANELNQLASEGSTKPSECKISIEVESKEIVNVIEVIPVTEKAFNILTAIKIWKS